MTPLAWALAAVGRREYADWLAWWRSRGFRGCCAVRRARDAAEVEMRIALERHERGRR